MMIGPRNRRIIRYVIRHNASFGQSEDWIFCVSLATRTCNGWRNVLSRNCRTIGRHFKRSVDTFILTQSCTRNWLYLNSIRSSRHHGCRTFRCLMVGLRFKSPVVDKTFRGGQLASPFPVRVVALVCITWLSRAKARCACATKHGILTIFCL